MGYDAVIDSARLNGALTATAEAIRSKTGDSAPISWDADNGFKEAVEGIATGGGDTEAAYNEGVEAGKKAEYDAFWDVYQDNGKRNNYEYGFSGRGWVDETFKPKYDIVFTSGYSGTNAFANNRVTNLAEALERQGVKLDTSKCGFMSAMFSASVTVRLPEINLTSASQIGGGTNSLFSSCSNLITIDKIVLTENVVFLNSFNYCYNLENLTIEGIIGQNGLNLQWSTKLSHESLVSIINCLQDKSGDTSGTEWVVTIGATNYAKLTEEDINNIQTKGWDFK